MNNELDWNQSPEYNKAWYIWLYRLRHNETDEEEYFAISPEFRNARLAYRQRCNASPNAETT